MNTPRLSRVVWMSSVLLHLIVGSAPPTSPTGPEIADESRVALGTQDDKRSGEPRVPSRPNLEPSTGATTHQTSQPLCPPEAEPHAPAEAAPRRWRGTGFFVGGTILATAGLVGGAIYGPGWHSERVCDFYNETCDGSLGLVPAFYGVSQGVLAGGMALVSVGALRRGRWRADVDALRGHVPGDLRHRAIVGWSLFGVGLAVWGAQFAAHGCDGLTCSVVVTELGLLGGAGLMAAGVVLAPHAVAYRRAQKDRAVAARGARFSVTPSLTRAHVGMAVSGRF